MEKRIVVLIILCLCTSLLQGCSSGPQKYMLSKEEAQKERAKQNAQLANPASIHCLNESGNSLVMKEDASGGQYGTCIFSDGSWCEEWAYYRGQCKPGMNMTSCEGQYNWKSACPPEYNPVCAKVLVGQNKTERIIWKSFNNVCKACTYSSDTEAVEGYVIGACTS